MHHAVLAEIVRRDPRYAYEAYEFVFEALGHTQKRLGRLPRAEQSGDVGPQHHVSGPELLEGIRDLAAVSTGILVLSGSAGDQAAAPSLFHVDAVSGAVAKLGTVAEPTDRKAKTLLVLAEDPEFGRSTYDRHTDGEGVCFSSWLRPILNIRPKWRSSAISTTWQLPRDLSIVGFLEQYGYEYEVATDHDLRLNTNAQTWG